MENSTVKLIFFGDIIGRTGRTAVMDFLAQNKNNYDFIIANAENASHGFGLTPKNYTQLIENGIDCLTSGNHIWDKKEIFEYIDTADRLVRPFNYPEGTKGEGYRIIEKNGIKIGVINALGRIFMSPVDSQWVKVKEIIETIKQQTPIIIMDFHAEATAEKVCFGKYCSELGISAFFGTHTHVQTADEKLLNNTAYITDVGFCGCTDSVIGMDYKSSLNRFLTCMPERYEVASTNTVEINYVEVEIDINTGYAVSIKRFNVISNIEEKEENES